jgi:hypothetical protein
MKRIVIWMLNFSRLLSTLVTSQELEEIQNRLHTLSMESCHQEGMQLWDIAKNLSKDLTDKGKPIKEPS